MKIKKTLKLRRQLDNTKLRRNELREEGTSKMCKARKEEEGGKGGRQHQALCPSKIDGKKIEGKIHSFTP